MIFVDVSFVGYVFVVGYGFDVGCYIFVIGVI